MTYRVRIELPTGGRLTVIKMAPNAPRARALAERETLPNLPDGAKVIGATVQRP